MLLPRQAALVPRQAVLPQAVNTNFQGASTVTLQADRQSARARVKNPQCPSRLPSQNSNNTLEGSYLKWIINLSSKPLTQAQRSVLAKGPNFLVLPRHPPNLEYITAIESVCTKLGQKDAELGADINTVLRSSHPQPILTKVQSQAIREFRRDGGHIVLTADKGVAMGYNG